MKPGDGATITRTISGDDVARYVRLGGARPPAGTVPEPLIGALWSFLLGIRLPGLGTMYLKQETIHHRPAALGSPLTARVTVTRLREDKHLADLDTECVADHGELIASGRALVYTRDVTGPRPTPPPPQRRGPRS